jgi:hypothetical protein
MRYEEVEAGRFNEGLKVKVGTQLLRNLVLILKVGARVPTVFFLCIFASKNDSVFCCLREGWFWLKYLPVVRDIRECVGRVGLALCRWLYSTMRVEGVPFILPCRLRPWALGFVVHLQVFLRIER